MGGFNAANARKLRTLPSPSRSATAKSPLSEVPGPHLLIDLAGHCSHASSSLAQLLQCGVSELLGLGWRVRLSPFAPMPYDPDRLTDLSTRNLALRLHSPDRLRAIVTRFRLVSDPTTGKPSGFLGRVQLVRVHRRLADIASAALMLGSMTA